MIIHPSLIQSLVEAQRKDLMVSARTAEQVRTARRARRSFRGRRA